MNARALIFALLLPASASAQGFAGLGGSAEGYALPDPATRFAFPADHGAHPEFRIEWWYVTANLNGADGAEYGVQWTLFRNALAPGGTAADQAWMAHAAISTPAGHLFAERFARGGIGQAGVTAQPFEAFIDEWRAVGATASDIDITAQGTDFAYDLHLTTDKPFVPQGQDGYSVKSDAGLASHYYSQPFYAVEGTLTLPSGSVAVEGSGWLDREWSSQPLAPDQSGWDWIALHLDSGAKLMAYRLRGAADARTVGIWIGPDGAHEPLEPGDLTMAPERMANVAGRRLPVSWSVKVPGHALSVTIEALRDDSWMATLVPYWEGPVRVTGSDSGVGYLEMSGYE